MEQFEFDKIPVDQITTGFFQVAIKNAGAKLDELEAGIKAQGLLQPIGVAKSQITEDNDDFEWEVLWGQRRVQVFKRLGKKEIPAMILNKVLTKEEGMTYALMENIARREMSRSDIFDAIKLIWIQFGDEKKCADETGIPLPLVRDALKSQIIDRLKGGRDLYTHVTETCALPAQMAHKVLEVVRKPDNVSVDKSKGEKLADVLAVQDVQMQNKILKAALLNPLGDIDGWVSDAKEMKNHNKKLDGVLDIELLEEEDYGLLKMAEANGITVNEMIKQILRKKLIKEGYLKEE